MVIKGFANGSPEVEVEVEVEEDNYNMGNYYGSPNNSAISECYEQLFEIESLSSKLKEVIFKAQLNCPKHNYFKYILGADDTIIWKCKECGHETL